MNKHDPLWWAARQVHGFLAQQAGKVSDGLAEAIESLAQAQQCVQDSWRQIQKAHGRGWHLAARSIQPELFRQICDLAREAGNLHQRETQFNRNDADTPTLGFLLAELRQLHDEFDEVTIQAKQHLIVARTPPIELEGLLLGPFAIELHINLLASRLDSSCFEIVALEPNPAAVNSEVTHPHVQSNALCAGDATTPISQALRQGRLVDAFTLVRSVLSNYNPHSPYVAIDDWDGVRCHDCDEITDRDNLSYCEHCENDFCEHCISYCSFCDRSVCLSCLETDPVSGKSCCSNCRHACSKCGSTVDPDRFVEDTDM